MFLFCSFLPVLSVVTELPPVHVTLLCEAHSNFQLKLLKEPWLVF